MISLIPISSEITRDTGDNVRMVDNRRVRHLVKNDAVSWSCIQRLAIGLRSK